MFHCAGPPTGTPEEAANRKLMQVMLKSLLSAPEGCADGLQVLPG